MSEILSKIDPTRFPAYCGNCKTASHKVLEQLSGERCYICDESNFIRNAGFIHQPYENEYTEEVMESFAEQMSLAFDFMFNYIRSKSGYDADGNLVMPREFLEEMCRLAGVAYPHMEEPERETYRMLIRHYLMHPIRKASNGLKLPDLHTV